MFRRTAPGTRCDSAFNVPSENGDLKMKQHTKVPIEGVGVVHVITKPSDNPEYAETDVMLSRYNGGTPLECTYLTGSITERDAALEMHTHWCDLERLINDGEYPTVRGLPPGRHLVRLVPPRGEREHPQASVGLHGDSDTKF
jgi:hypothetical protein